MATRRQDPANRKFNQTAFASSTEYERGILANLVAARAGHLTDAEEITMLWWLQQISWRDGGLDGFAAMLLAKYAHEIATPAMLRIGTEPARIYTADQVRAIREELPGFDYRYRFPLRGESGMRPEDYLMAGAEFYRDEQKHKEYPDSYPAGDFLKACALSEECFSEYLKQTLVDPASDSLRNGRWNFPRLWDALVETRETEIASAGEAIVETEITRQVHEELDYALESRGFVLVEGREGIGKSEAARVWCAKNPGRAVYVRLESGNDETTLYRAIARAIGTACTYTRKAVEMRARIQDALQSGHLILVIDEAHFLWPQSMRIERAAMPKRLDWLRTAIVDHDVPVALISTPQFFERQCDRFRKVGWNANQIQRRIARTAELPEALGEKDMIAVARCYFPNAAPSDIHRIAAAALLTIENLTAIKHLRKRVDFLASRRPRESESSLIKIALDEKHMLPAMPPMRTAGSTAAAPVQTSRTRLAQPIFPSVPTPENRLKNLITQSF